MPSLLPVEGRWEDGAWAGREGGPGWLGPWVIVATLDGVGPGQSTWF